MNISKCKACGAPIAWVGTRGGKFMPCDAKVVWFVPSPTGSRTFITITGDTVRGEIAAEGQSPVTIGRVPHWATCPKAGDFRRKNGGTAK